MATRSSAGGHALGLDFGTESARVLVVEVESGAIRGAATRAYANGVITGALPGGSGTLSPGWALQDPADWLEALAVAVPAALAGGGVKPSAIVGVGIDFTSCTILPCTGDGTPLCALDDYRARPHAWPKLWKHHAAQRHADRITDLAASRGEPWLARYGGRLAPEWVLPKACELLAEDAEVYHAAAWIVEAADWIAWQLTGRLARNACAAGYKAGWHKRDGYPSPSFLAATHPDLADLYAEKLAGPVLAPGARLGELTESWARRLGLAAGTPVAVPMVDAHAAVLGAGVAGPGTAMMVMGTSACQMLMADREVSIPGIAGVVEDGILPGLYAYEAGQPAVGDLLAWFLETMAPRGLREEAARSRVSVYELANRKAAALRPGESGIVALDWWNGNRSLLKDGQLGGLIAGMTLATRPEEVYRALVEATAFGARVVLDAFVGHGLAVNAVVCSGGLARDACLLGIYADALDREQVVAGAEQASAIGAAMLGAAAAGPAVGGYASLCDAVLRMAPPPGIRQRPRAAHRAACDALYRIYRDVHDHFGRGGTDVMRRLAELRHAARVA